MPRSPRSALTLIRELDAVVPNLKVERQDEDGLGVFRTFRITTGTHKGVDDVVSVVADERIVNTRSIANGVEVTFSSSPRVADDDKPFQVADAAETLISAKPKKRAARKAAPKNAD
jgi:hypothetical protein